MPKAKNFIVWSHWGTLGNKFRDFVKANGGKFPTCLRDIEPEPDYFKNIIKEYVETSWELLQKYPHKLSEVRIFVDIATYHISTELRNHSVGAFNASSFLETASASIQDVIRFENKIIGELDQIAQAEIRAKNTPSLPSSKLKLNMNLFKFAGYKEYESIIKRILQKNPALLSFLGYKDGKAFTYDAPKFSEAIERVKRHQNLLAHNNNENNENLEKQSEPILRLDEDVIPYAKGLDRIMQEYNKIPDDKSFFFSGSYGSYDESGNAQRNRPLDHFACRSHYCYDFNSKTFNQALFNTFFSDFRFLGAVQIFNTMNPSIYHYAPSAECANLFSPALQTTRQPQITSGAAATMSGDIIMKYPPFIHFKTRVTWIDDHLKRRLLEVNGVLNPTDLESIEDAKIDQERHPGNKGLDSEPNIKNGVMGYFPILMAGCMFHSLILDITNYSNAIQSTINRIDATFPKVDVQNELSRKFDQVVKCWSSTEYSIAKPSYVYEWATVIAPTKKNELISNLTKDAEDYLKLLQHWPAIVACFK